MQRKAQAFIIVSWIIVIFTLLAVSIAHRVAMNLRVSRYLKDRLRAAYLAKAAINKMQILLDKDKQTSGYDSPIEEWADSEKGFKQIYLNNNKQEFATMSYETRENGELKINFGAIDEERKININSASLKLFIYLLEGLGVDNPAQLSRNILIWRGDLPDTDKIYESLGYSPKADKFNNIEELELVKGITSENFNKIKDNVTVYSDGFINANTVSEEILTLLAKSVAENQEQMSYVEQVVDNIIQQREANSYFKTVDDIVISDLNSGTSLDEELFYSLKEQLKVTSEYFKMQASGYIGRTQKNIQAVYYRTNKKIVYWHEN